MNERTSEESCEKCGHVFEPGEGRYALPDRIICIACCRVQDLDEARQYINLRLGDVIPGSSWGRRELFSLA